MLRSTAQHCAVYAALRAVCELITLHYTCDLIGELFHDVMLRFNENI